MKVVLENISKRYLNEWVFKGISHSLLPGESCALLGANGSGKSTLLKIISGQLSPSEGSIVFWKEGVNVTENIYEYVSYAAPYLELPEELTFYELMRFHFKFKKSIDSLTLQAITDLCYFKDYTKQPLKFYSSGMKQRAKLALAIFSDTPLLLLDEPTGNLDEAGIAWYKNMINEYGKNRTVVVCSNNINNDYFFCKKEIVIENYK